MDIRALNGATLAYIGDGVMSMWVREYLLYSGNVKPHLMQRKSEAWVSAKAQARFVKALKEIDFFSEEEWNMVLRGRNANIHTKAKNADIQTYKYATGLEALIGWLYLNKQETRLQELWEQIKELGEQE